MAGGGNFLRKRVLFRRLLVVVSWDAPRRKIGVVIDPEIDQPTLMCRISGILQSRTALPRHRRHARHTATSRLRVRKSSRERYGINVIMHRATDAPYIDLRVDDGDEIQFGQQTLKVIYTPGHTQDAMCLLFKDRIFTGDTLLIGGCGRTDLPGGNAEAQYESLAKLKTLGDQSVYIRVMTTEKLYQTWATRNKIIRAC